MAKRLGGLVVVALAVVAVWLLLYPPLPLMDPGDYERASVAVYDAAGEQRGTVEVRIADTREKRRVGLSRTDSLGDDTGMLFVHGGDGTRSYVMRNMSFPLDIVFVAPNGTITSIHHAPPDGSSYRGRGRYVLEVPRGWTTAAGVAVGGRVEIPEEVA